MNSLSSRQIHLSSALGITALLCASCVSTPVEDRVLTSEAIGDCAAAIDWADLVTPAMAPQAVRSGYCDAVLDVDASGEVVAVRDIACTEDIFEPVSRSAMLEWQAEPGDVGCTMGSRASFILRNDSGKIVPIRGGLKEWDLRGGTATVGWRVRR